jgi:hypothetical protein
VAARGFRTVSPLIAGAALALLPAAPAPAQAVQPHPSQYLSGMQTPQFPPAGDWAEVVTVTAKWIVLQNEKGQQFPVAIDSIAEFVIRWPIHPGQITPGAIVETTGIDLGSNQIRTDHVDVFEGNARRLVQPTYQQIIGFGRTPTSFDYQNQNLYGVRIALLPGEDQIPNRLHVAGPVAGLDPLQIAFGGNNAVAVLPSAVGLFFSQVTPGTFSFLRPGDLVYVIPSDVTARSLILNQMVAYKSIPLSQFVP